VLILQVQQLLLQLLFCCRCFCSCGFKGKQLLLQLSMVCLQNCRQLLCCC
jgi:hypothetical protein